jgi:hypothetical protein
MPSAALSGLMRSATDSAFAKQYCNVKMAVLWDVVSFSLVEIDELFRGVYYLHLKGDRPETSVKFYETLRMFILTAARY